MRRLPSPLTFSDLVAARVTCLTLFLAQIVAAPVSAQDMVSGHATALTNVHVVSIQDGHVLRDHTIVVEGGRISAVGPRQDVVVPAGTTVIDGAGLFAAPGLVDAHVHLTTDMPWAPARPEFGDAALYLAHGVTTVVNLRGTQETLEWRRRVQDGDIPGPTIYTSGEFINEPGVVTPEDIDREIDQQQRAGYDLLKYHEVWQPGVGFLTTEGLPRAAYARLNARARELNLPLVGHAPVNLGLEDLLVAKQDLAHAGALSNLYFLPLAAHRSLLLASVGAGLLTIALAAIAVLWAAVSRRKRAASNGAGRACLLLTLSGLACAIAAVAFALVLPGGPLATNDILRWALSGLVCVFVGLLVGTVVALRAHVRQSGRINAWDGIGFGAAAAGLSFAAIVAIFWLPLAWRSSLTGIDTLARRLAAEGIAVQTTLVAYDALGGPGRARLVDEPAIAYLSPETQRRWRAVRATAPAGYRYTSFMQRVVARLHAAGVPIVAGTDAMGLALVTPGASLHREMELLAEAGLRPPDVLQTATLNGARSLGRSHEFGDIAPGMRADIVLVGANPLEDLTTLRAPEAVMANGRWFSRANLDAMLAALRVEQ